MKDTGIEGIYIVHAVSGYELHERRINELFSRLDVKPYEFVTGGDLSCLTPEMLRSYFCPDIQNVLRPGIMSCTLNHILAYERIVEKGNKLAIVFENDPFFLGNFEKKLRRVVQEAKSLPPGFLISLENTTLRFPSLMTTRRGKYLYKSSYGRCAGAYIIDLEGAKRILADLKHNKCGEVIDWWHNTLIKSGVVDMYWAHPPLTEQGSHNGRMHSTISSKSQSIVRRIQWVAQKYYRTYIRQLFKNDAY